MKGIIVEIRNNKAVFLSEDGSVLSIHNNNYCIGQEVNYMKKPIATKKIVAIASIVAALLIVFGLSTYNYASPYYYVSLDINPSIEFSLNRFDKVLSVKGVNDDGERILADMDIEDLKYMDIEDAISLSIDELSDEGYFNDSSNTLVLTSSCPNNENSEELLAKIEKAANEGLEKNNREASILGQAVGLERVEEARELGVTPGKLNLVEKLKESAKGSEDIIVNEWLNKSVKEILGQTNQYKELYKETEQNLGEDTQNQEENTNAAQNGATENNPATEPDGSNNSETQGNEDSNKPETSGSEGISDKNNNNSIETTVNTENSNSNKPVNSNTSGQSKGSN